MAKIKCETVRYEVVSRETGKSSVILQRRYLRSERLGRTYRDTPLRSEIRDAFGRLVEHVAGSHFRDPASGEEFEISDFARQTRAVAVAA